VNIAINNKSIALFVATVITSCAIAIKLSVQAQNNPKISKLNFYRILSTVEFLILEILLLLKKLFTVLISKMEIKTMLKIGLF
jgi:hypothetical protein